MFITGCPIVAQLSCMTLLHMSIAGFPIIAHSGQLISYWADLNIIPSKGIGAFVSNNGLADPSVPLKFALDVLNGVEPWLNASTVCTYPQPWQPPPTYPAPDINMTQGEPARKLIAYTGTYGQPVFGNITVYETANQTLKIQYGRIGNTSTSPPWPYPMFFLHRALVLCGIFLWALSTLLVLLKQMLSILYSSLLLKCLSHLCLSETGHLSTDN